MRAAATALALLLAATAPLRTGAEVVAAPADEAALLEGEIARAPDDPDLHWALARALAREGRTSEAADRAAEIEARWPGHVAGAPLARGRWLYEAGRDEEAAAQLAPLADGPPCSGPAALYRGLALRRLGRTDAADSALAAAAACDPALSAETLLVRGVDRLSLGDEAGGEALLRDVIAVDPSGDAGRRARVLMNVRGDVAGPHLVDLNAHGGYEYDSNVTLESGTGATGVPTDQGDFVTLWGAGVDVRPWRGEHTALIAGYRYDQSLHRKLSDYDVLAHQFYASGIWRVAEPLALRLDGNLGLWHLGGEPYGTTRGVRPNLFLTLDDRVGVTRLYGEVERRSYDGEPALSSLDRDGMVWAAGLEHTVVIPRLEGATATLRGRWERSDTDARRDLLGFDGAYDYDRWEGGLDLHLPLVLGIVLNVSTTLATEHYRNANVIDFLTDDGVGNPTPRHRRDQVVESSVSLVRPIGRYVDVELAWRGGHHGSNVDLYAYDREVIGMHLRVHTF